MKIYLPGANRAPVIRSIADVQGARRPSTKAGAFPVELLKRAGWTIPMVHHPDGTREWAPQLDRIIAEASESGRHSQHQIEEKLLATIRPFGEKKVVTFGEEKGWCIAVAPSQSRDLYSNIEINLLTQLDRCRKVSA